MTDESIVRLGAIGRVLLSALAVYPVVMIVLAAAQGPGISIDSVSYAAAATSWAESGQLLSYDGRELSIFPAGLPVVTGSLMALGLGLSSAVTWANGAATLLTVLGAYFLGREVLRSPRWALLGAAFVALTVSTVRVGSYFWTEPVFTALLLWALVITARALRAGTTTWWMALGVGLLVSAASTYRFVGIVAVPVLALGVVWAARRHRLAKGLLVLAAGSIGFALSAVRNLVLGAPALGERYPGSIDAQGAVVGLVKLWGEYIAPSSATSLTVVFGGVVLVLLVAGGWLTLVKMDSAGILVTLFVAVYWAAILVSQVGTRLDVATERFGAPVLAPAVVLVLVAIRRLLATVSQQVGQGINRNPSEVRPWISAVAGVVLIGIVSLSVFHTVRFVSEGSERGLGLASQDSMDRNIARVAADLPPDIVIASNDPWQVWWARGSGVVLDYPPSLDEWPGERIEADTDRLTNAIDRNGSVTVLLDEGSRASLPIDDLVSRGVSAQQRESELGVAVWELTVSD